jgi:hypothetical protein
MTGDAKLRAIMLQIIKDNPGADEDRYREIFFEAIENDKDAAREAVRFFVSDTLRKQGH